MRPFFSGLKLMLSNSFRQNNVLWPSNLSFFLPSYYYLNLFFSFIYVCVWVCGCLGACGCVFRTTLKFSNRFKKKKNSEWLKWINFFFPPWFSKKKIFCKNEGSLLWKPQNVGKERDMCVWEREMYMQSVKWKFVAIFQCVVVCCIYSKIAEDQGRKF